MPKMWKNANALSATHAIQRTPTVMLPKVSIHILNHDQQYENEWNTKNR
jgi:hypothetical protein